MSNPNPQLKTVASGNEKPEVKKEAGPKWSTSVKKYKTVKMVDDAIERRKARMVKVKQQMEEKILRITKEIADRHEYRKFLAAQKTA